MQRIDDARLQELKASGVNIYSFSRLGTINNCLYEAYRTYILNDRGNNNIYAILGGKTHDVLEKITNGEATEADLLPTVQEELDNLEMLGIDFPKDNKGGDSIRNGWIADMTHFCKTYNAPVGNFETESLFIYKTPGGHYLQGYIDLTKLNKDGSLSIYDYKTSSMYNKSDLLEHGRQLVVYAMGKMQEGYEVKQIAWIMLKYVDVTFYGYKTTKSKNKTQIKKTIERRKIGSELAQYVEQELYEAGYDDIDTEMYLTYLSQDNDFSRLPEAVAHNFIIKPCVLNWELSQEIIDECNHYIDTTIDMWEQLDPSDEDNYPPRKFTKITKSGNTVYDYFYCSNLCGHRSQCPYLHDFLEQKNIETEDYDDLF